MADSRKLIEEIAGCMKLLDMAIDLNERHIKYPSTTTKTSKEEMSGLIIGARNCTISHLRSFQKEIGVKDQELFSTFKK